MTYSTCSVNNTFMDTCWEISLVKESTFSLNRELNDHLCPGIYLAGKRHFRIREGNSKPLPDIDKSKAFLFARRLRIKTSAIILDWDIDPPHAILRYRLNINGQGAWPSCWLYTMDHCILHQGLQQQFWNHYSLSILGASNLTRQAFAESKPLQLTITPYEGNLIT